ncbi:NAD-dependent epimerase/dehydratase [Candidatus Koribacter versatilis Ellin345]|uniref:NAD-dependent epimerase/dehydratase n=1 Tax=Koribacter versatilis (strain Ellin345) TaxID=204669 RepID=Q1IPF2_KORVE|nr:NAD-dependent epimerase/dehydratase family protein [Candidatus Koribacter versatilis]ABF41248.1 NAD-dependent epimerase/dehydratase [Candidatus Koribacter versatilis Ellin345]
MSTRPAVIVTGVAGNLGRRLLLQLGDFDVTGVDVRAPEGASLGRFEQMDLGTESASTQLIDLLRATGATTVVHLAFIVDPLRSGVLDEQHMWQVNVAGTARVMEAISVVNRYGGAVSKFIYPSSVAVYGPETDDLVDENSPLKARSLPYALHKQECEEVVRYRQEWMTGCRTYMLRPHIFAGATVENYMIGTLRGTFFGNGKRAARMKDEGKRLPALLPWGKQYLEKKIQFAHVDDVARLIAHLLRRPPDNDPQLTVLNVAGRGEPLTIQQCTQIAGTKIRRVPSQRIARIIAQKMWDWGISGAPPEALPYMMGSYTMNTSRLKAFLGAEYENVIQFTVEGALRDSVQANAESASAS